jgi:Fe-S cluster assembly iron-binding protein IscA
LADKRVDDLAALMVYKMVEKKDEKLAELMDEMTVEWLDETKVDWKDELMDEMTVDLRADK